YFNEPHPGASQNIQIVVCGDALFESDETFTVQLTGVFTEPGSVPNGQLGRLSNDVVGLSTIQNDDVANSAPTATVSINEADPKTGDTLTTTVTTDDDDGDAVNVTYAWFVNDVLITDETGSSLDLGAAGNGDKGDEITVVVTPNDGTVDGATADDSVTVANSAPVVTISGASSTLEGESEQYAISVQDADDEGHTISAYSCGVGQIVAFNPIEEVLTCLFGDGDALTSVSATATDGSASDAGTLDVTVDNVAPTIALSGDATVDEGSTYTLTLGDITDPGTDTVTAWVVDWGDGTVESFSAGGEVTHVYADGPNDYSIAVDLTDEDGTFEDAGTLDVTVDNVAPTIDSSSVAFNEGSGNIVSTLDFSDPGVDDDPWDVTFTYTINGTESSTVVEVPGQGAASNTKHLDPGCYSIEVAMFVTDKDGGVSEPATWNLGTALDFYTASFDAPIKLNYRNVAKWGNVVPVKVTLASMCVPGTTLTTANLHITIVSGNQVEDLSDSAPDALIATSQGNPSTGTQMTVQAGGYHYNLNTKTMDKNTREYTIRVRDGSASAASPVILRALLELKK
ncbi:MAG TPA: PKD domain-containing protein, partial [Candidatus Limnocylindria bacterium]